MNVPYVSHYYLYNTDESRYICPKGVDPVRPAADDFLYLLCPTPDDFTRQGIRSGIEKVEGSLCQPVNCNCLIGFSWKHFYITFIVIS